MVDEQSTGDALNEHLYKVARKVDRVLNAESIENHAALIGMLQVHQEMQTQTQKRFGVQ